jgi:predicted  nucleic acid-binding Zn-ribbon protein
MPQQQEELDWKAILRDSIWLTVAWEWLQTLLGRAVDLVLWVTMIFSCYQLIPGAPQPPTTISTFMFVLQFVALDVGGMSLNRLAQQQGLDRWAYARVVAYILIGITLVTISYAGIEHAVKIDASVTNWIEVLLVIARSIMTVLYGQAIHSLKMADHNQQERLAELEALVPVLRHQLESEQQTVSGLRERLSTVQLQVSSLQHQVDSGQQEVDTLRQHLDSGQQQVSNLQEALDAGQGEVSSLQRQLNAALVDIDTLRAQLDGKQQELVSLRETLNSGQQWQESRIRQMLETEQQRVSSLQQQLLTEQNMAATLRRQLNTVQANAETLQSQLDNKQNEVERVLATLDSKQQEVDILRHQLSTVQQRVSSLQHQQDSVQVSSVQSVQVDSGQPGKVVRLDTNRSRKGGQQDATSENAIVEQIKQLLKAEPGLSARQIAARLGCSPTTASRWKGIIENSGQATECVNE